MAERSNKAALPWPRLVVLAAVGGAAGFLGESFHAWAGVWTVPPGAGHPYWVAAVYFAALLAAGLFFQALERRTRQGLPVSRPGLALEALLFLALFLSPSLFHRHELMLAAAFAAYVAVRLCFFRADGDLATSGFAAAVDLAFEGTAVAVGVYHYPSAGWTGVPLWLVPFWAGLGLSLRRFFRAAMVEAD